MGIITLLIILCGTTIALPVMSEATEARPAWVWISFEVEGAKVSCPDLRVLLRSKSRTIRLKRSDRHKGAFEIPAAVADTETVDLTVRCGKHRLFFPDTPTKDFRSAKWRVGSSHPPFPEDLVAGTANADKAKFVTYMVVEPIGGEAFVSVILHFDLEKGKR